MNCMFVEKARSLRILSGMRIERLRNNVPRLNARRNKILALKVCLRLARGASLCRFHTFI